MNRHQLALRRYLYADEELLWAKAPAIQQKKESKTSHLKNIKQAMLALFVILVCINLLSFQFGTMLRLFVNQGIGPGSLKSMWGMSFFGGANMNEPYAPMVTLSLLILLTFLGVVFFYLLDYATTYSENMTTYGVTDQRLIILERFRQKLFRSKTVFMDYGAGDIYNPHLINLGGVWQHVLFSDQIEVAGRTAKPAMVKRIGFYSIDDAEEVHAHLELWLKHAKTHQVRLLNPDYRCQITYPEDWSAKRLSLTPAAMDNTLFQLLEARINQRDFIREIKTSGKAWNTLFLTKRIEFEKETLKDEIIYNTIIVEIFEKEEDPNALERFVAVVGQSLDTPDLSAKDDNLTTILKKSMLIGSFSHLLDEGKPRIHTRAKVTDFKNGCQTFLLDSKFDFGPTAFALRQAYAVSDNLHFRFTMHCPGSIDENETAVFKEIVGSLKVFPEPLEQTLPIRSPEKKSSRFSFSA